MTQESIYLEALKILLNFLTTNAWPIFSITLILITRRSIANIFERLTKFNFSFGSASGAVEAAIPPGAKEPPSDDVQVSLPPEINELTSTSTLPAPKTEGESYWILDVYNALEQDDKDRAQSIYEKTQESENIAENRYKNRLDYLYFVYARYKEPQVLIEIKEIHENSRTETQRDQSATILGFCLSEISDYESERNLWQASINETSNIELSIKYKTNLGKTLYKLGDISESQKTLRDCISICETQEQKSSVYRTISEISKDSAPYDSALALRLSAEYAPGDKDKLFDAAYALSNTDLKFSSPSIYQKLLKIDPDHSAALNNIGVCAGELKCSGTQVEFYKRSVEKNSSLAMSNLASLYIQNGFYVEADNLIKQALQQTDPHKNIGGALQSLKSKQADEEDQWKKVIEKSSSFDRELVKYGESYFSTSEKNFSWDGDWVNDTTTVQAHSTNNKTTFTWESTEKTLDKEQKFTHKISTTTNGNSLRGTYTRTRDTPETASSLLGFSPNVSMELLGFLAKDRRSILFFPSDEKQGKQITLSRRA